MADDLATLRDGLVSDDTPAAPAAVATPAVETPEPVKVVDTSLDSEALELGRVLRDSGVSKDQLNQLLEAPKALEAIRYQIQNNPAEFLQMLERTDPKTGERFLESMADTYVSRYGDRSSKASGKPEGDTSDVTRELEALREETNRLKNDQARRDQQAALASATQRFNARVDDLFNLEGVKKLGLTKSEEKAMRAQLNVDLGKDSNIVQRISSGNFVDVPRAFQGIIDEWANDKKAAAEAATKARERSKMGSFAEFQNGPNPFMIDIPDKTFDSWDATEDGFAKALLGAR